MAPFTSRDEWSDAPGYEEQVSDPAITLGALAGKAHLRYAEAKAVVGGVTAIQGTGRTGGPYEGWLVRNVEHETFKTGDETVRQSVIQLDSPAEFAKRREQMEAGFPFIYHLSEGTDRGLVDEINDLDTHDCLGDRLVGIHCTALGEPQFGGWEPEGSIVWSPFSNLWLYAHTTDVMSARDKGQRVCLGADWSPSGSKNLLGELKVADLWNRAQLGRELSDEDICAMATRNPADAIGWSERLGRLREGLHGDVLVTTDRVDDPYRNLIESVERDVHCVAINGQPF